MKEFIEFIVKHLVDDPESVSIQEAYLDKTTLELTLRVASGDVGKVIGKQGKTAIAMRTLLTAIASRAHKKVVLKIVD
jgi:uncharacterized protein